MITLSSLQICKCTFTRKDNLMAHLRIQHIAKDHFKCKQCAYHTKNFSKLIIHVQKNHLGIFFTIHYIFYCWQLYFKAFQSIYSIKRVNIRNYAWLMLYDMLLQSIYNMHDQSIKNMFLFGLNFLLIT